MGLIRPTDTEIAALRYVDADESGITVSPVSVGLGKCGLILSASDPCNVGIARGGC